MSEVPDNQISKSARRYMRHVGILPRPAARGRYVVGRSRLHYQKVIESDPAATPERLAIPDQQ